MKSTPDPLAALADLPGVAQAVAGARTAVDGVLWPRALGADGPALAVASRVHGAQACAAVEGVDFAIEAWRSADAFEDSPMGRSAAGIWRGYSEAPGLVSTWAVAPLQALARLHAVVAADLEDPELLGRPRQGEAADPLRLGTAPAPDVVAARLSLLGRLVGSGTAAPAIVEAAVVHGEVFTLAPFTQGSGAVARLATRLVLAARGLDPDLLTVPEVGLLKLGRPAYVDAARRYATGSPEGVAAWLRFIAKAVEIGAAASQEILLEIRAAPLGNAPEQE